MLCSNSREMRNASKCKSRGGKADVSRILRISRWKPNVYDVLSHMIVESPAISCSYPKGKISLKAVENWRNKNINIVLGLPVYQRLVDLFSRQSLRCSAPSLLYNSFALL